jgi:uncharacterized protein (TIGR02466 family)
MLLDGPSLQATENEIDQLLVGMPLENNLLSLLYDLSKEQQVAYGGTAIYKPANLIKELQFISLDDNILKQMVQEIRSNPTLMYNRAGKPTLGGEQSHELLFNSSTTINKVFTRIKDTLIDYGGQLPSPMQLDKSKEHIVSGWAVSLRSGGRQLRHTHPESKVSAVLYIQIPEEIEQTNDGSGCLYFSKRRSDQQADEIKIKPAPGKLVMFPSFFPHETIEFFAQSDRICIACNLLEMV